MTFLKGGRCPVKGIGIPNKAPQDFVTLVDGHIPSQFLQKGHISQPNQRESHCGQQQGEYVLPFHSHANWQGLT
jgi:hypothetical protein